MADRELLELAAKACGYVTSRRINAERLQMVPPVIGLVIDGVSTDWNPLENDDHALRLAVQLRMSVMLFPEPSRICEAYSHNGPSFCAEVASHNGGGLYAATRRAIVRAAAALGEMK